MSAPVVRARVQGGVDLARVPVLGPLLRWRHLRTFLQSVLLAIAVLVIYDGFTGSPIAPKNLAGVLPWVQWRGLTVLSLLIAGSLFCTACPFMLFRRLAKWIFPADRAWPARLRGKWIAIVPLAAFFWFYEALDPWATPWLTAALALAYFVAAFAVDGVFRGATFCKYLCPIGQFNFVNSTCSPLEVRVRDHDVCAACRTKDCIAGSESARHEASSGVARGPVPRPSPAGSAGVSPASDGGGQAACPTGYEGADRSQSSVLSPQSSGRSGTGEDARAPRPGQPGCELFLFQPRKVGNVDCTFCLDCLHACPYDNVTVATRLPMRELWDSRRRSSLGRLEERPDVAFLALVVVFAAFLNAFGMVGPFYGFERSIMTLLSVEVEWPALLAVFAFGLVVLPLTLVGVCTAISRALAHLPEPPRATATRFSYSLVPLGFGMWAAHYGFHFLTGGLTLVPVLQGFLVDVGIPFLGEPRWDLAPLVPASWLLPIEITLLEAGLLGSIVAAYRIAEGTSTGRNVAVRAFLPWAALALLLFAAGVWLMLQPMEMRGTLRAG